MHEQWAPPWLSGEEAPAVQKPHGTGVGSLGWEDPLQKGMAAFSSILTWRSPRTEEPGGLQSTGSQRVGHDRSKLASASQTAMPRWLDGCYGMAQPVVSKGVSAHPETAETGPVSVPPEGGFTG